MRIDGSSVEQLPRSVDHCNLTASSEARVNPQDDVLSQRRLTQQGSQIVGKDLNGMAIGCLAFFTADIPFDCWEQKTLGCVAYRQRKLFTEGRKEILLIFRLNSIQPVVFGNFDAHSQYAFLLTPRNGKDLVRLDAVGALFKFIIGLIDGPLVLSAGYLLNPDPGKLE